MTATIAATQMQKLFWIEIEFLRCATRERSTSAIVIWLWIDWTSHWQRFRSKWIQAQKLCLEMPKVTNSNSINWIQRTEVGIFVFPSYVCMISLCRVKHLNERSCHKVFHSRTTLIDCCSTRMDSIVHPVPHQNQPSPPIQGEMKPNDASSEEPARRVWYEETQLLEVQMWVITSADSSRPMWFSLC